MTLSQLNNLPESEAKAVIESCCCAPRWIEGMLKQRPYQSVAELLKTADDVWATMERNDYLAAFEGHPQIGDVSTLREKFRNTANTAGHEQSGMQQASEQTLQRMMELNSAYLEKFGFIFIVFASGKSAEQMLELIEQRIDNDADTELKLAAAEQAKITKLRLEKLL